MDAETRHQLKDNELAQVLEQLRNPRREVIYWIGAVIAVILLVVAIRFAMWTNSRSAETSWWVAAGRDMTLTEPAAIISDLKNRVSQLGTDQSAVLARLSLASGLLNESILSPESTEANAQEALQTLQPLLDDRDLDPTWRSAAVLLSATAHENLREYDQAREAYQTLLEPPLDRSPYSMDREIQYIDGRTESTPSTVAKRLEALERLASNPPRLVSNEEAQAMRDAMEAARIAATTVEVAAEEAASADDAPAAETSTGDSETANAEPAVETSTAPASSEAAGASTDPAERTDPAASTEPAANAEPSATPSATEDN